MRPGIGYAYSVMLDYNWVSLSVTRLTFTNSRWHNSLSSKRVSIV